MSLTKTTTRPSAPQYFKYQVEVCVPAEPSVPAQTSAKSPSSQAMSKADTIIAARDAAITHVANLTSTSDALKTEKPNLHSPQAKITHATKTHDADNHEKAAHITQLEATLRARDDAIVTLGTHHQMELSELRAHLSVMCEALEQAKAGSTEVQVKSTKSQRRGLLRGSLRALKSLQKDQEDHKVLKAAARALEHKLMMLQDQVCHRDEREAETIRELRGRVDTLEHDIRGFPPLKEEGNLQVRIIDLESIVASLTNEMARQRKEKEDRLVLLKPDVYKPPVRGRVIEC